MPDPRSPVLIVCAGLLSTARPGQAGVTGQYLKAYDPDAHDGRGHAEWTTDPAQAMRFPGIRAARACWAQIPRSRPVRGDGRPGKPLTAFSITFATPAEETT